jgi:nicotinamidase-related amidase
MDFQNYALDPKGYWPTRMPGLAARFSGAVENMARVLAAARRRGILVVFVGQAWRKGHTDANLSAPWQASAKETGRTVEGTWEVGFFPPLTPVDREIAIYKRTASALTATELDRLLLLRGITTLVLAGLATNWVVEGTAREASDRGYRVIVLRDCCAAMTDEEHEHSVRVILPLIGAVITADEFVQRLEESRTSP